MLCAGVDIGSRTVKVAIIDSESKQSVSSGITDTGAVPAKTATRLFEETLEGASLKRCDIVGVVSTGYGRGSIDWAARTVTEISCQASGCAFVYPQARTVVDIGGQDSKIISLSEGGQVRDFALNDRCAAGTGRFLEMVAGIIQVPLGDLGGLAGEAEKPMEINSTCAVFAESEIVGLLGRSREPADIVAGVIEAIARRTKSLAGSLSYQGPMVFTGGVARNGEMVKALTAQFDCEVLVPDNPQLTGALGAALLAGKLAG